MRQRILFCLLLATTGLNGCNGTTTGSAPGGDIVECTIKVWLAPLDDFEGYEAIITDAQGPEGLYPDGADETLTETNAPINAAGQQQFQFIKKFRSGDTYGIDIIWHHANGDDSMGEEPSLFFEGETDAEIALE